MKPHLYLLFFIATSALADTSTRWSGMSQIDFSGTSTLHGWAGKVNAEPFTATVTLDEAGVPKHIEAAITVEAVRMDTDEAKRDEAMRKAMKVDSHPLITATVDARSAALRVVDKAPTRLPMTLHLLGKSQQVEGTITKWEKRDGKARFELEFPVSMKSSGISVPPFLLVIRVGDTVTVHASVTLTQL